MTISAAILSQSVGGMTSLPPYCWGADESPFSFLFSLPCFNWVAPHHDQNARQRKSKKKGRKEGTVRKN